MGHHDHGGAGAHEHDHNLRAAYLHVLADALTSLLAIVALLAAKYLGLAWMDPLMGIVGAVLVGRWSLGLMRDSGRVLLDRQAPEELRRRVVGAVEGGGDILDGGDSGGGAATTPASPTSTSGRSPPASTPRSSSSSRPPRSPRTRTSSGCRGAWGSATWQSRSIGPSDRVARRLLHRGFIPPEHTAGGR